MPGRHAALISARKARRCCLESRAEEALEGWRDAVSDAIHAGLVDTAADWLYSIRDLNVRYGPWTTQLDEEHRLAQALHATGSGRLLDRSRDPREAAMSAMVSNQPREAVLATRRWLTDAVVTGSWADEQDALSFLGDLYQDNGEPLLAASYFQRAGQDKELTDLADKVGDLRLPIGSLKGAPWWTLNARAALISAQADLLDDSTATALLDGPYRPGRARPGGRTHGRAQSQPHPAGDKKRMRPRTPRHARASPGSPRNAGPRRSART